MAKAPLISIITVNLNNLEGLKKTMQSVFEQTWQEFEYIVIDGGSTDGSKEYIESNKDKIDYWVSEKDKGVYNAMNKGIKIAKGEYLYFLNSGDILYDTLTLKKIAPNLKGNDVVYGNLIKVYRDERGEQVDKGVNGEDVSLKTFIKGNLNHQATFLTKNIFEKYGLYDESLKIVSDWKLYLIALGLNNAKVKYKNIPIAYYDMAGLSSNIRLRDEERRYVIKNEIPLPLFLDYLELRRLEEKLNSPRYQKFEQTDKKGISRKLHSIIFRLFS
ncbi:glycosyltransferase family 2 protein [Salegentibacter sediminis]|uniref:glycosyltransferase family 2 protein n=1 Tax=Salegentibacter sediminis TaxID=1930251 RepID=UPI0009BFE5A0|nr:glycosyltransferase family 2 protein [Salegentibacter sediminis]